jgi:hypothetical protein
MAVCIVQVITSLFAAPILEEITQHCQVRKIPVTRGSFGRAITQLDTHR